jgi:hypothetical protein
MASGRIVKGALGREERGFFWNALESWVFGQMLLWGAFQIICVPFVLLQRTFLEVVTIFQLVSSILGLVGIGLWWFTWRKRTPYRNLRTSSKQDKRSLLLWCVFWMLLLFQVVMAFTMTYGDGDDSYYVAVSTLAQESNTMYLKLPYTGGATALDARHGLAPFPIWIAYLAQISGIRTVSVAHVAVPALLIPMTYAIYAMIGKRLPGISTRQFKKDYLPIFMIFLSLLVLFGDYSIYSVENFLIARTRQGKAAFGNLVIPALILLLLIIVEKIHENRKMNPKIWICLTAVILTGCLCSTLGTALCGLLLAVVGLISAISFRKWKFLIPLCLCCVPTVVYIVLYLRIR